ncbi:MAG TPA: AmmeMemoRadiSam system radical SAM enzyme [Patescibacteria group bacterium]|nr:AmmeMemoRadiSam system radical SAM enzyme [Patescibacteria group bacterium]
MKHAIRAACLFAFLWVLLGACIALPRLTAATTLKEALFYEKLKDRAVQCHLCPRNCLITEGRRGFCGVRENRNGTLYTLVYSRPVAVHIDPIEKKPLFHFLPGTAAYSIATAGCNLRCKFCQNWEISQRKPEEVSSLDVSPEELVRRVKEAGSPTIAYTYTEPTIFYEYMLETAKLAKKQGIRNMMHSAGYINKEPLEQLLPYLDAANIDLKGFSDDYYARFSDATLGPVLETLKAIKKAGVHLEVTNLIVPGFNDDSQTLIAMCRWIKDNLGADTPLHFSRFFPLYKLAALNPTPVSALEKARDIALDCGLKYVYIGNISPHPAEQTYCPACNKVLIRRSGYIVLEVNIVDGKCKFCGEKIAGVWN